MLERMIRRSTGTLWASLLIAATAHAVMVGHAHAGQLADLRTENTSDGNFKLEGPVSKQFKSNVGTTAYVTSCNFQVRFSSITAIDVGGTTSSAYAARSRHVITFYVDQNGPWILDINHQLRGMIKILNGGGPGHADLTALTCSSSLSGSMPALTIAAQNTGPNPINGDLDQTLVGNKTTTLSGTNPAWVSLSFEWTATVYSDANIFGNGPEVGVRLGENDDLSGVTVGHYTSEEERLADGHFVTVSLRSCPGPLLVPALGWRTGVLLVLLLLASSLFMLRMKRQTTA